MGQGTSPPAVSLSISIAMAMAIYQSEWQAGNVGQGMQRCGAATQVLQLAFLRAFLLGA